MDPQAGMLAKSPPTVLPIGTVTLPPRSNAETSSRRVSGLESTSAVSSPVSMYAP
jgi:hypothetical protein